MFRAALYSVIPTFALVLSTGIACAQTAPEIGYVYPSGGRAGTIVDVTLGGYDWTPDMQLFVHDPRIKLEMMGPPSPVLVPDPPYWFGAKGRGPAWPLPREFPGRLTIPADIPPGPVRWQVANANGASPVGLFHVGDVPEVVEDAKRQSPQVLPALPVTISGQIRKIEEIDRYEFTVPKVELVTIELVARQLGSPLHGMLQIHDEQGQTIVDAADSEGQDLTVTFLTQANAKYTLSLHDLDFAGDRSYVYRLMLTTGPRVQAAYPAAGRRGETCGVEFVGIGVASGAAQLESTARDVTFPAAVDAASHFYRLDTPAGSARPYSLLVSDIAEQVQGSAASGNAPALVVPGAVTGAIETRFGSVQHTVTLHKDEKWRIAAQARAFGSALDLELSVIGPDGKEIAANDDAPGTTDALVALTVPADGTYRIVVTDRSGKSGTRAACYRLSVEPLREDFALTVPTQLSVPIANPAKLTIQATRAGGFKGPIQLALSGLPEGVTVPSDLAVQADKNDLAIEIQCATNAPAAASLCSISATAKLNDQPITRRIGTVLVATVMKPRCKITPEGLDDVRKVHRGSTYLAPLLVERLEGFQGEVTLEMTSKQQRHRQGLASDEYIVPPGITRVDYPIFVPEWMETTKTSRMILNGVVKATDPRGTIRTLVSKMEMRIGILPEGALLKLSHSGVETTATPGGEVHIPLTLSRAPELQGPIRLELIASESQSGLISAEPITLTADRNDATLAIRLGTDPRICGEQSFLIRATAQKEGRWPVVSETTAIVPVRPAP
jgi:hypothetical protein